MSFLLAGLASGLGDGLQTLAENRRQEALRLLEEQQSSGRSSGGSRSTRPRAITRGMTGDIRGWAENEGLDENVTSAFITETERVLSENPDWTENRAWEYVRSNAGRGEREVITQQRRLLGLIPEETEMRPGNYDGTFNYPGQAPAAAAPSQGGAAPQVPSTAPAGFGAALGEAPAGASVAGVSSQQAPQPGDIIEGYRFLGGDPADQNNWQRV